MTIGDLVRNLVRPRFLIPAFFASALLLATVHRQGGLYYKGLSYEDIKIHEFEFNRKAQKYFDGSTEISRKLLNAEQLYQKQVHIRRNYIAKNNAYHGAWLPKAKEMMPFWWYFQPSFNCPHEVERVGRFNDGGKWMCGMTVLESMKKEDKCIIYSLGVFDDSSWEKEMIDRTNCQVYAFDASVKGIAGDAAGNPNIHFFKVFVGDQDRIDEEGNTWKTLKTIMKDNGHEWIDVLKVDIEGNEFAALNAMMDQFNILPFSQLQLEIHVFGEMEDRKQFMDFVKFWERLEDHHLRPFWSELNTVYSRIFNGLGLSEYSFINIAGKHRLLGNA
ncbi:MAG: methyltransferase domain-containing protein [Linnemannia elongata]|nr:MAG: methyltransferase domain-containing protein [Linnemannia elongata]